MIPELTPDAAVVLAEMQTPEGIALGGPNNAVHARAVEKAMLQLQRADVQTVVVAMMADDDARPTGRYGESWETAFQNTQTKLVQNWQSLKRLGIMGRKTADKTGKHPLDIVGDLVSYHGLLADRGGGLLDVKEAVVQFALKSNNEAIFEVLTGQSIAEYISANQERERERDAKRRRRVIQLGGEEDAWVQTYGSQFVATSIGCSEFLTVFANVDRIQGPIPPHFDLNGTRVPIRVLRADGFLVLRAKMTPILRKISIGGYSLQHEWRNAAFFLVMCTDSPFHVAGYKFIELPPSEPWDISGGLENVSKLIGPEVKGVGQRLIEGTLALAKAYGIRSVRIATVHSAHGFYVKMGFQGGPGSMMTQDIPYSPITRTRSRPA